jgi:hypothetical protein
VEAAEMAGADDADAQGVHGRGLTRAARQRKAASRIARFAAFAPRGLVAFAIPFEADIADWCPLV